MIIEKTYNTKTRNLYKKVGFIDELYIRESKLEDIIVLILNTKKNSLELFQT